VPELAHDIVAVTLVVLTAAVFAAMAWAGRAH
jgi:hypothetical protein